MYKERSRDLIRTATIIRETSKPPVVESVNYTEEYISESFSDSDTASSISSQISVKPNSPPLEIIRLPTTINEPSALEVYQGDAPSSFLSTKQLTLLPSSSKANGSSRKHALLRRLSWIPTRKIGVENEVSQISVVSQKKQSSKLDKKSISLPVLLMVSSLAIGIAIILILALLLSRKRNEPPFTSNTVLSSACAENCMMSITPPLASTIASWPFDGSLSDLNNVYSVSYANPPGVTYVLGNFGDALAFDASQYLYTTTNFMNLSYRSWTIEAWLLVGDVSVERGLFGQCQLSSGTDQCLSLTIKNQRLHLGFGNHDLTGATLLSSSIVTWRHVAFVYDYTTMRQLIYLDGNLETTSGASDIAVGPYKGTAGPITIGKTNGSQPFNGYIDHMQVTSGAKTACQILNDAILTAYYAFDVGASYLDSSNNFVHGIPNLLINVPGRVNYAYSFQYEYSYFLSLAFTAYSPSEPFSVALWINPFVVTSGTLIHISTSFSGTSHSCFDMLGFSSSGQLIGQVFSSYAVCCPPPFASICPCQSTTNVGSPTISVNTWTHVVLTYSAANGLALFTNGILRGVSSPFSSFPVISPDYKIRPYMSVGNPRTSGIVPLCLTGSPSLSPAAYQGYIDELRIYSRELTKTEICSLYHT